MTHNHSRICVGFIRITFGRGFTHITVPFSNFIIEVDCIFNLCLIDGKVLNYLTDTNSANCPLCGCKPNDFQLVQNLRNGKFLVKNYSNVIGCQGLHSIINSFNYLLHLTYKKNIKKWRASQNLYKERKQYILKKLEVTYGIKFDVPTGGGAGNTTNGKFCRKVFENPASLAQTLELDEKMILNLCIVLWILNSQCTVNIEKFTKLCYDTYIMCIDKYNWYKLPATVHKMLAHSPDLIGGLPLPPGFYSEEGQESNNRFYKAYRLNHASKFSKKANISDMFTRAFLVSDPVYSSVNLSKRMKKRKKRPIPSHVKEYVLIENSKNESISQIIVTDVNDSNDDSSEEDSTYDYENIDDLEISLDLSEDENDF